MFHEQTYPLTLNGKATAFTVRRPGQAGASPALLINLASDRHTTLDVAPYRFASDLFLAAGHVAASFDLPNHGDLADEYGEGLEGIAAAMAAGHDPFMLVAEAGGAVIDACVREGLVREGRVFAYGTSRGGLSALHLTAADARVCAVAVIAPVTHLPALREFASLSGSPIALGAGRATPCPFNSGRKQCPTTGRTLRWSGATGLRRVRISSRIRTRVRR